MIAALLITLRETLEASLVVGIILAYLNKTKNKKHGRFVWFGVLMGVLVSVVLAYVFERYLGGFEGAKEQIYEGITMLVATVLLTWMILWMLRQRQHLKGNIEGKVSAHIEGDHPWGLFFLTFVSVVREGIETVIFLKAVTLQSGGEGTFSGALLGILLAILISFLLFKGVARFPLRKFFTFTSVLLILFAAGLFAHAVHEFQEAYVLPIFIEHIWDLNSILDENASFGALLKGLFGYNGNPSLLEVLSYLAYLVVISVSWRLIDQKK